MKRIITLLCILSTLTSHAQENAAKKPEYVIIVNDEIVTKDKVDEYGKTGYLKGIQKGVSDEEMKRLTEKFGDKVGNDKRFIVVISLLTEKEKKQKDSAAALQKGSPPAVKANPQMLLPVNEPAKNFKVQMIDGKSVLLSDLKGKVVLLNFWATWCAPCIKEFYDIPSKITTPFRGKEFVFLAVSKGEPKDKVAKEVADLKSKGIDLNAGIDPNESIWKLYGGDSLPKSYLIDQNGVIRFISTGYSEQNLDNLAKEITKLLEK